MNRSHPLNRTRTNTNTMKVTPPLHPHAPSVPLMFNIMFRAARPSNPSSRQIHRLSVQATSQELALHKLRADFINIKVLSIR